MLLTGILLLLSPMLKFTTETPKWTERQIFPWKSLETNCSYPTSASCNPIAPVLWSTKDVAWRKTETGRAGIRTGKKLICDLPRKRRRSIIEEARLLIPEITHFECSLWQGLQSLHGDKSPAAVKRNTTEVRKGGLGVSDAIMYMSRRGQTNNFSVNCQ